jgi:hypothetical protein
VQWVGHWHYIIDHVWGNISGINHVWGIIDLLRKGNISGRPCMGIMTYNALAFSTLKHLGNYHRFYTISFEIKPIKWCISGCNAIFLVITQIARLFPLIGLMSFVSVRFTY